MNNTDICKDICPCSQCDTESEDCEMAKAYGIVEELRDVFLRKEADTDAGLD